MQLTLVGDNCPKATAVLCGLHAIYVIPEDTWYIFPTIVVLGVTCVYVYPHRRSKAPRYEAFRDAWRLLEAPPQGVPAGRAKPPRRTRARKPARPRR